MVVFSIGNTALVYSYLPCGCGRGNPSWFWPADLVRRSLRKIEVSVLLTVYISSYRLSTLNSWLSFKYISLSSTRDVLVTRLWKSIKMLVADMILHA